MCIDQWWGVANILSGPTWPSRTTTNIERSIPCMPTSAFADASGSTSTQVPNINRRVVDPTSSEKMAVNPNLSFSGQNLLWPNSVSAQFSCQAPHLASSWRRKSTLRWCTPCDTSGGFGNTSEKDRNQEK